MKQAKANRVLPRATREAHVYTKMFSKLIANLALSVMIETYWTILKMPVTPPSGEAPDQTHSCTCGGAGNGQQSNLAVASSLRSFTLWPVF